MAKFDWSKAKNYRGSEPAHPGGRPRGKAGDVKSWEDLERMADQAFPAPGVKRITAAEIEAGKTPKGAWKRSTLAKWGVSWPPPKGWKDALIAGAPIPPHGEHVEKPKPEKEPESLESRLLHQVVMALNSAGMAHLLADCPDVLEYYNGRLPTVAEIIGPTHELVTGEITLEDRVWSFTCARLVATSRPCPEQR